MNDERPLDPQRLEAAQVDPPLGRAGGAAQEGAEQSGGQRAGKHGLIVASLPGNGKRGQPPWA